MKYEYKREPLTSDEANQLSNSCQTYKEKLIIWTLLDTGLRVAEFCALDKESMDWQTHRLMVRKGKGGKRRVILLKQARSRDILESHLANQETMQIEPRTCQKIIRKVANRAKIKRPCSPHVLRHTFAVQALKKGVNIVMLGKMLGHESINTTMIYLNLSPEDVIKEMEDKL
jgi:integrase/recombinase XerD